VLARVRKDPIWSKLPAVRDGHVVAVNNELSYASPHAHLTFLDEVQESLTLLAGGR
jgi:ABC-type Fe3+-hydroxamate transport system substrate-binding protein